jgi:hypothetical protein
MRCNFHLMNCHETILAKVGIEVLDLAMAHHFALRAIQEIRTAADQANEEWRGCRPDVGIRLAVFSYLSLWKPACTHHCRIKSVAAVAFILLPGHLQVMRR